MNRSARACALVGFLLLAGVAARFATLSREHATVVESGAKQNFSQYADLWKSGADPPLVAIGADLLPPSLPGPGDAWAGGRPHSFTLTADVKPGSYLLEVALYDTHDTAPPTLTVTQDGKPLQEVRLKAGRGGPPPYTAINPELAVVLPFTAVLPRSTFVLTSRSGSWLAPARVRVSSAQAVFNPAKGIYLLLARNRHLFEFVGLVLGAIFFGVCAIRGLREAAASLLLLAVSLSVAGALGEAVFREWLIRKPGQRAVWTPKTRLGREQDRNYTYRTMIRPSSEPDIPYELKPNLDGMFAHHPMVTNSLGMRGPELEPERKPETLRVVGLGDSVMMGWGVSYDETALTRVGRLLAASTGRSVETANLGCPSYNTVVETATYRSRGRRLKSDLVVLIFMDNDFGFPGFMLEPVVRTTLRKSYLREQFRKRLVPLWRGANDYEQGEEFVSSRQFEAMQGKQEGQLSPEERWLRKVQEHYQHMMTEESVRGALKELAGMIREDGAAGVVVYDPVNLTVGDPGSYEKKAGWVVATARELGFEAVDMTPVYESHLRSAGFQRMEQALWVSPGDWHSNAEAHRLIAEAVAALVREKNLLVKR